MGTAAYRLRAALPQARPLVVTGLRNISNTLGCAAGLSSGGFYGFPTECLLGWHPSGFGSDLFRVVGGASCGAQDPPGVMLPPEP